MPSRPRGRVDVIATLRGYTILDIVYRGQIDISFYIPPVVGLKRLKFWILRTIDISLNEIASMKSSIAQCAFTCSLA